MSKDQKSPEKTDSKSVENVEQSKKTRIPVVLLVIAILVGAYFLISGQRTRHAENKAVAQCLEEAEIFIEKRKFERAKECLTVAREYKPESNEISRMETELNDAQVVHLYEKELTEALQSKNWDEVNEAARSLMERSPDHPQIAAAQAEVRAGRHRDELTRLVNELSSANKDDRYKDVLALTTKLKRHDPQNPLVTRWDEMIENASAEIAVGEKKAKQFHQQALLVDKGVYTPELFSLANRAKKLSDKTVYAEFFDKVSNYPRIIRYPNEYASLQEAIDIARPIDTIQISQGAYHAPVRIDSEVTIVGEEGQSIILHSSGKASPVIYVSRNGKLTVKSILFKHVEAITDEQAYSTIVVEGEANFNSCAIYQSSGHGVHVLNGGKVAIQSCRLEANRWDGVAVSGLNSLATLKSSVVSKNKHNGIDAWDGGSIEFIDSFSESNSQSGAYVSQRGKLKISGSTIRLNEHTGLYVAKGGNADVKGSEVSSNRLAGAYGTKSGLVTIEGLRVTENSEAGIVLTKDTSWRGLETVVYEGNGGKTLWEGAEFEMSDEIKEVLEYTTEEAAKKVAEENAEQSVEEVSGATTEGSEKLEAVKAAVEDAPKELPVPVIPKDAVPTIPEGLEKSE